MKSGETPDVNRLIGPGSNDYGRQKTSKGVTNEFITEEVKPGKPTKPKPQFYSVVFAPLQEIAKGLGYNLVLHGSMSRDMDLVAIPWIDEPENHETLIGALCDYLGGEKWVNLDFKAGHCHKVLPGGRDSYIINLNRNGEHNGWVDAEYYLDISITPLITKP